MCVHAHIIRKWSYVQEATAVVCWKNLVEIQLENTLNIHGLCAERRGSLVLKPRSTRNNLVIERKNNNNGTYTTAISLHLAVI